MRAGRTALLGCLLATACLAGRGAAAGPPAASSGTDRLRAAKARLADDLAAVAQWLVGEGLEARREETLRFVLALAPDHAEAQRALGWRRREGRWEPPPDRPPPVDKRPARLPAWRARWEAAFSTMRDALLDASDPAAAPLEPLEVRVEALGLLRRGLPEDPRIRAALDATLADLRAPATRPETLERLDDALEAHAPDDAHVRAARGHVLSNGRWVLAETARALARRPLLRAKTKAALDGDPRPAKQEPFEEEKASGLAPIRAWEAPRARVLGTVADAALARVAFHLDRSGLVFDAAFGLVDREWEPPITAWEVRDLGEALRFARHLGARGPDLEEMRHYSATWMGGTILTWTSSPLADRPEWRVDVGLKLAHQRRLRGLYGLRDRYEALVDGLARYLVWLQAGTRLSWTIDRAYTSPLAGASLGGLHDADFDWARAASETLRPARARGLLRLAVGKSIEAQTTEDAVVCYAFAAYLFEGHETAADALAKRLSPENDEDDAPPDLDAAFREVFGWRVEQVERRLERWCREVGR